MDEQAFEEAVRRLEGRMYRTAVAILWNDADAADAMQECILHAWQRRGSLREASKMDGWMMRILVNECRNIQRQRQRVTPMEDFSLIPAPERDDMREVYRAISALPESLRLPLCLKYLEDLSEKEAAQALGLTVTTFKSRLHRARKLLRKSLDREVTLE